MIPRAQLQAWSRLSSQLVQIGFLFAVALSLIGIMGLMAGAGWLISGQWSWAVASSAAGGICLLASFFINALVRMIAALFELLLDMQHSLDELSLSSGEVSYGLDDRQHST